MVVDSVVDPAREKIWYQANLDQDIAFERRWRDWENWVAGTTPSTTSAARADRVQAKWLRLRAAARANPVGGVVGPAELIGFFQNAPYYDSSWAASPQSGAIRRR